jgi:hypothetical protein
MNRIDRRQFLTLVSQVHDARQLGGAVRGFQGPPAWPSMTSESSIAISVCASRHLSLL